MPTRPSILPPQAAARRVIFKRTLPPICFHSAAGGGAAEGYLKMQPMSNILPPQLSHLVRVGSEIKTSP